MGINIPIISFLFAWTWIEFDLSCLSFVLLDFVFLVLVSISLSWMFRKVTRFLYLIVVAR